MSKVQSQPSAIPPNRLRELRRDRNWSLADVAVFLTIDESLVSLHERSKRRLTTNTLDAYVRLFQVNAVEIFQRIGAGGELVPPGHADTKAPAEET